MHHYVGCLLIDSETPTSCCTMAHLTYYDPDLVDVKWINSKSWNFNSRFLCHSGLFRKVYNYDCVLQKNKVLLLNLEIKYCLTGDHELAYDLKLLPKRRSILLFFNIKVTEEVCTWLWPLYHADEWDELKEHDKSIFYLNIGKVYIGSQDPVFRVSVCEACIPWLFSVIVICTKYYLLKYCSGLFCTILYQRQWNGNCWKRTQVLLP